MTGRPAASVNPHDPGAAVAAERAASAGSAAEPIRIGRALVSVGAAGWTDPTLTARGVFYPRGTTSAEARLRYYATRFSLVEVDSSYYALPSRANAERWIERTPPHFTFDIKAFALMTGHPTETARLPVAIRSALPAALRAEPRLYAKGFPSAAIDAVWDWFRDAVAPLAEAGRFGAVLLQYPPWVGPTRESPAMLEEARARLAGVPLAVEFRNPAWLAPRLRNRTFGLLERLGMSYVAVDEPQGTDASVPPDVAVTSPRLAVLRMHGQRADTWAAPGVSVAERFRYLYSTEELERWTDRVVAMAEQAERVHIVFNNCYANYGVSNAAEMASLLGRLLR
jgi:uncharacterized protein YecE (DUF72 family)